MFEEVKFSLLKNMFSIRFFEEKIAEVYSREIIRCPVHLAIGHEAAAVGVCANLTAEDPAFGYHRSHHHYMAKGGNSKALLWELLGDSRGCSGGRGGSTHLTDHSAGFIASTAIISGTLPLASGMAHALKFKKSDRVCTVFCGDAAPEEGVFFETLNMAALWKLPLLIVIEDNDLSCYTDKKTRQSFISFKSMADLFSIKYMHVDGSDIKSVYATSKEAISFIRNSSAPCIIHAEVFRALEHCGPEKDDLLSYRKIENKWPALDPIEKARYFFTEQEFMKIRHQANIEISDLFKKLIPPAEKKNEL